MIWVIGWIGMVFLSALCGDVWALLSPLRTLFRCVERGWLRWTGSALALARPYPERLGMWPAVVVLLGFAWAQLIWLGRDVPAHLAWMLIGYAAWTWLGMLVYGRETWLRHGEGFAVAFGVLARLAPFELRTIELANGREAIRWALRPPALGLLAHPWTVLSGVVFVLAMLATVSFDGLLETAFWQNLTNAMSISPTVAPLIGVVTRSGLDETQVLATLGLVAMPALFFALYLACAWAMARLTDSALTPSQLACRFVLSLVPIALAYDLAHNLSMFVASGQFIIPLASDPFGRGWNLFGTAGFKVNLLVIDAETVWYCAVAAILLGHVASVYLAHVGALQLFRSRRAALLSQIPIVVLMMIYTMSSLWILAQPIVG
jgi:hypothetical protein